MSEGQAADVITHWDDEVRGWVRIRDGGGGVVGRQDRD